MNEEVTKKWVSGQCPDELTLQLYAEGETDAPVAELVFHHLAHCHACSTLLGQIRELQRFCLERLGEEDLREAEFTRHLLQEVKNNLPPVIAPATALHRLSFWKHLGLAATFVLCATASAFWFLAERQPGLSAKAVLDEAELRERLWEYQPGKVLHWVIEADIANSDMLPDGHYRTLLWRSNVAGQGGNLLRKYDEQNRLIFARWIKADGTQIVFRSAKDGAVGTIYPNLAEMRAELQGLPEAQRSALEKEFAVGRDLNDVASLAEATAKHARRNWEQGKLQIVNTAETGQVFRLRSESLQQQTRVEMERDMSVETFRQVRLFSRHWLADGRIKTEEARWTVFREATLEEIAANDLTALLAQTKKIEHVNAKAHVQKLLSLSSTLQRSPTPKPTEP